MARKASLVFDSFRQPTPAGVRVVGPSARRLLYKAGRYLVMVRLEPGADGVYRSQVLPGLWLDAPALLRGDLATVARVAQEEIASAEHAAFVKRLQL